MSKKSLHFASVWMVVLFSILACQSSTSIYLEQEIQKLNETLEEIENPTELIWTAPSATIKPPINPTITQQPAPVAGAVKINPMDNAAMVFVPEGAFLMGTDDPASEVYERPMHSVSLDSYWIYQTEVTNAQFAAFVESTGYVTTAEQQGWSFFAYGVMMESVDGANWQAPDGVGSDINDLQYHPVVHVSWYDAAAYCQWVGGTLPTEAQWEKAARGEDGRKYPWGDSPVTGDRANYCAEFCAGEWADNTQNDGYTLTAPVGSYPSGASPYGAVDMAGNVWEWVSDWYSEDYYSVSPFDNPFGPNGGVSKVHRGGSWFIDAKILQTFSRGDDLPEYSRNYTGFRCVQNFIP